MTRKAVVAALISLLPFKAFAGQPADSLLVMFWNVENFFDYTDGGEGESDWEFSASGKKHWTRKKFCTKCNFVAKSILWIADRYGRLPDVIGLAEVENRNVLYRLLNDTALKKADYRIIHFDSRDRRGIDVALLYRKSVMYPVSYGKITPVYEDDTLNTRDILYARMSLISSNGRNMNFVVNHHPSKFGGEAASRGKRRAAMECMMNLCDSLSPSSIISMGDFNDVPGSDAFDYIGGRLVNKAEELHAKGRGTIRYQGKWELIDMFLTSPDIDAVTEMQIAEIPFLMVRDNVHPGIKPFRTYSGPRYIGGVSDHCPILLWIFEPIY